jgi:hypothetical protein
MSEALRKQWSHPLVSSCLSKNSIDPLVVCIQELLGSNLVNVRNLWTLLLYWAETPASGALRKALSGEH